MVSMVKITLNRQIAQIPADIALDADQMRVVALHSGAMRVLAGPGCGKTTTLVAAMAARLSPDNPNPLTSDQVLGLTFARKSALDWRSSVSAKISGAAPMVTTFHSFAYALLRGQSALAGQEFRLLAGAEQQVLIRELLADSINDGQLSLSAQISAAADTKGLAEQVRGLISRARSFGLDSNDLQAMAKHDDHPLWATFAPFMDDYLDNLDAQGLLDYSELILRATLALKSDDRLRKSIHQQYRAIFVDEYQDVDPGQIALLKALLGPDCSLIVVGDIDQAIYGFRGADEAALGRFVDDFAPLFSAPIETVVLGTTRRFGQEIRNAATAVLRHSKVFGFTAEQIAIHRNPVCDQNIANQVELSTFDSAGSQGAHIADALARAYANDGLSWDDMAIIVRSSSSVAPLVRALTLAGIPTEVASDEIPLALDPALYPLLLPLRITEDPNKLDAAAASDLLTGPLCQLDLVELRTLARLVREHARETNSIVPTSDEALRRIVAEGLDLKICQDIPELAARVNSLVALLADLQVRAQKNSTPHELLWAIWSESNWSKTLEQKALAGSQSAHRDLDAIVALFALAARFVSRGRAKDLTNFLADVDAQEIPIEPIAQANTRGKVVRILTAHRAKGLQWPLVVIADMQEQLWPDLRLRGTLLSPELIGKESARTPETHRERLAAERKLAYVAITRAQRRLLITSVDSTARNGEEQYSRFMREIAIALNPDIDLDKFGQPIIAHTAGRPKQGLSADALVAYLRTQLTDPAVTQGIKHQAAAALAKLRAAKSPTGLPLVPLADPKTWWATNSQTPDALESKSEISLSASSLATIEACPAKWFLESQASAAKPSSEAMIFGNVLHRLADAISRNEIEKSAEALHSYLEKIWPSLHFEAGWYSQSELDAAKLGATRLVNWLNSLNATLATEVEVKYRLATTIKDVDDQVVDILIKVNGFLDAIAISDDTASVYDLKTSTTSVGKPELIKHAQLGLYLHLIEVGDFGDLEVPRVAREAALVQLRLAAGTKSPNEPKVQSLVPDEIAQQPELDIEKRLIAAAEIIHSDQFVARAGKHCDMCSLQSLCPVKSEGKRVGQ